MRDLESEARHAYEQGASLQRIVGNLRVGGCDLAQTIRIVQAITGRDACAAQQSMLYSNAWRHERLEYEPC